MELVVRKVNIMALTEKQVLIKKVNDLLYVELHPCNTIEEMGSLTTQIYDLIAAKWQRGRARRMARDQLEETTTG